MTKSRPTHSCRFEIMFIKCDAFSMMLVFICRTSMIDDDQRRKKNKELEKAKEKKWVQLLQLDGLYLKY